MNASSESGLWAREIFIGSRPKGPLARPRPPRVLGRRRAQVSTAPAHCQGEEPLPEEVGRGRG